MLLMSILRNAGNSSVKIEHRVLLILSTLYDVKTQGGDDNSWYQGRNQGAKKVGDRLQRKKEQQ